ncbi:MAG: CvpA family protein [bacterium]|nr:CvpA family protein [bacterium]
MINLVDIFVLGVLIFFAWQGFHTGLLGGVLNLLTTGLAFLLALLLYPYLGSFLSQRFDIAENFTLIVSFFFILVFSEITFGFLATLIYKHLVSPLHKRFRSLLKIDKILGIIPSLFVGAILASLFLLLPLLLPVTPGLRSNIADSFWGEKVLSPLVTNQRKFEKFLNRLPYQNLIYLLTPSPESQETVKLSIPAKTNFKVDSESEKRMFSLVNKERKARGLKELLFDSALREVARDHCLDMFKRSYFSHYTPEGKSPFDRMKEAGITYLVAGENLAYAASVEVAHQGLMNSQGHRENILRGEFGHLGVGVIDGGLSGKIFCQEFKD